MKYLINFAVLFCLCNQMAQAQSSVQSTDVLPQRLSMAKIIFSDSREYYGNVISQQAAQIQIKLIPTGAFYVISKKGVILSSNGKYAKGSKVQSVIVKNAGESIYDDINQANFTYGVLGFQFPDGKVQYANALTIQTTFLAITMQHSNFTYYMYYKNGEWKIDNAGGEYKNGTIIKDIFELDQKFKRFY